MTWPTAKRNLIVSITLIGLGLGVCGWQIEEHVRFQRSAAQALINRGRDITSTLGVVIRSQRRNGILVPKERLQASLQDLIRPEELESIAILSATGELIASAGQPIDLTQEMLRSRGVFWGDQSLVILNVMDLGPTTEDGVRSPVAIVASSERIARAFRPPSVRRPDPKPVTETAVAPAPATTSPATDAPVPAAAAASSPAPATTTTTTVNVTSVPVAATPGAPSQTARPLFSRPTWMTKEEYENVIQKQGVHSLVLSMSTNDMRRAVQSDLLLRSLVSLLALGGCIISVLAWRNVGKSSELQIRLIKAGEMNTHLKEMNFAAAGLAHETRNPLNLIRGLAQMISMQGPSSPKLKEHASTIIEEADRVTVQLNEFINYSKPREAHLSPVEIKRLVADVARTLVPDIEEKQITLRQPDSPLLVEADEQLLRQALFNVLLNATQAVAPGGQIEIKLTQTGPRDAVLEIGDDGPGVPAAERANIFKPYVTMRPKGVGLGLAIVHQIVSAHHWEIACVANEPRGALFRFSRLKLAVPTA
jgi:signal transduction histidine kinase